ncbi:hypothetical protein MES5069_520076 [Mesorhizobium escarrei]|uniref:Uncharacterized protein n=1 Tax=Mesorhizobium escarrei TaxID=666018 RepID=A0ABN8K9W7_9HYPH|nr:hypothetical protein MES5069_520076 [Mesorhizobium escarrei]
MVFNDAIGDLMLGNHHREEGPLSNVDASAIIAAYQASRDDLAEALGLRTDSTGHSPLAGLAGGYGLMARGSCGALRYGPVGVQPDRELLPNWVVRLVHARDPEGEICAHSTHQYPGARLPHRLQSGRR